MISFSEFTIKFKTVVWAYMKSLHVRFLFTDEITKKKRQPVKSSDSDFEKDKDNNRPLDGIGTSVQVV